MDNNKDKDNKDIEINNGKKDNNKDKKDNNKDKKDNNKDKKDIEKEIDNVITRNILRQIKPYLNKCIGGYYVILHSFIMVSAGTILLFDNNIYHLFILLCISCLDGLACIILHDCPLTILENKYLNQSMVNTKFQLFNNSNILYKCNHEYEKTLEFLTNMISFLFGKINALILMKLFSIKINN